jgi:hypothetical protein
MQSAGNPRRPGAAVRLDDRHRYLNLLARDGTPRIPPREVAGKFERSCLFLDAAARPDGSAVRRLEGHQAEVVRPRVNGPEGPSYATTHVNSGLGGRDVPTTRSNPQRVVTHLDSNRVPAPVMFTGGRVSEEVLFAQFVSDPGRRRIEIARISYELGAATTVVGEVAQGNKVHGLLERSFPLVSRLLGGRRRGRPRRRWRDTRNRWIPGRCSPAWRRKRPRHLPSALLSDGALRSDEGFGRRLSVDRDCVHERFRSMNQVFQGLEIDPAVRVVAIRND